MTVEYWVGGFFVDLSRNQITQNQKSQTLAPKALAVLTYLAENQGKVVSHHDLLDRVWPDTNTSPNTLQRSIAQLRKALGDDGKEQVYIKTHAKQGYSLECDVRWHNQGSLTLNSSQQVEGDYINAASSETKAINQLESSGLRLILVSVFAGLVVLSFIAYQYFFLNNSNKRFSSLTFDNLRSITATDDKEFDASYTPDGKHIVFHRYLDKQCVNKIWAKNISTQKESLLTKGWGAYGSHSFSNDGKKLVFLATQACNEPVVTQKKCYDLVSLDFAKALESPQQPKLILQCKNSKVRKPIWLGEDNIALLQSSSNRWKLINYSVSKNESVDLYHFDDKNLVDYAYSQRDDLIAVISIHEDGQLYIEMLKSDGRMLSSHQIQRPPEMSKFRLIYPSFDPTNEQLIFSTGKQLFTLTYDGRVAKINLPFADKMVQPKFHPDGSRLLLLKGPYDSDIVRLSFDQIIKNGQTSVTPKSPNQRKQTQKRSIFERSNLSENYAIFQPNGDLIAFRSERSGEQQIWVSDGIDARQLTHFPTDTSIGGVDWAADGQSLLVNANGILTEVGLDSNNTSFALVYPVVQLFQWDSKNNTALALLRIKGVIKFAEVDLNRSEINEISDKAILWALKSEDGRLIYKDTQDQFWQPGPAEAQHIKQLNNHGGKAKSFVINDNVIYAIDSQNQLWSYDLKSDAVKILGQLPDDVDYLTDVNKTELLITVKVSAKKEIVELSMSDSR